MGHLSLSSCAGLSTISSLCQFVYKSQRFRTFYRTAPYLESVYLLGEPFVMRGFDLLGLRLGYFSHLDECLLFYTPCGGPVCQLGKPFVSRDFNCRGLLRVSLDHLNQIMHI